VRQQHETVGLGIHSAHDTYKVLPPLSAASATTYTTAPTFKNYKGWTVFVFLLPFVDQIPLYDIAVSRKDQDYIGPYPAAPEVYGKTMPLYLCPSDASSLNKMGVNAGNAEKFAGGNYGANYLVFGNVPTNDPNGKAKFQNLTDGTSNIIFVAERYLKCGTCPNETAGGCDSPLWADANAQWRPDICKTATYAATPNCPLFQSGVSWNNGCISARAQTLHSGSMNVVMGDATVRNIAASMSGVNWALLCDPRDGQPASID
jgi:hypothetical protein